MKKAILISIPIIILLIIVAITSSNSFKITTVLYDNLESTLKGKKNYVLYTDSLEASTKSQLKLLYDRYGIETFNCDMTDEQVKEFTKGTDYETDDIQSLILYFAGKIVYVTDIETDAEEVFEQFDKYILNIIPDSEKYYKEVSTADEYIKKVNSDSYTVAVFGKESCTYCSLYLPVINKIAQEKKLDIYYFDADNFDEDEYEKITALDFEIPSKCTTTGYSTSLSKSFPKPMTIITKKGEFVDCIKGYVTEDEVLDVLEEYKIVKES